MATVMQQESTQYVYLAVTGTVPNSAEVAFLAAGVRPTDDDWQTATLITSISNPLWNDAKAAVGAGTYYLGLLVGDYNDNTFDLDPATYTAWCRLNGDVEQVVLIAPTAFTVAGS